jgi:hypothetical protein
MKFRAKGYQRNLYGPAHLWSLEYLALMLAGFAFFMAISHLLRRQRGLGKLTHWLDRWLASPWRPLILAIPTTMILWAGHRHVGLDAIMDRLNSFTPEVFRFTHNALFFAVGVCLHRMKGNLSLLALHRWKYLTLSVPVFALRAWLIKQDLMQPLDGGLAVALTVSGALFTWLLTFGLLGLALGTFDRSRPAIRYLADSSYWVYLCHLPLIGLIQLDLFLVPAPAAAKFSLVLTITMGLCLSSYHVLVRHTFLGIWLHGHRDRTEAKAHYRTHIQASTVRSSI